MAEWTAPAEKPLKGMKRCRQTDCTNGLHCFLKHRKRRTPEGTCLACGSGLVDWTRVHQRDLNDVAHTIQMLKLEHVRHEFWCTVALTVRASTYAHRLGRIGLLSAARKRIASSVGKAAGGWDGTARHPGRTRAMRFTMRSTPPRRAAGSALRSGMGYSRSQELSARDVEYFAQLLLRYVVSRIPNLANDRLSLPRKAGERTLRKAS